MYRGKDPYSLRTRVATLEYGHKLSNTEESSLSQEGYTDPASIEKYMNFATTINLTTLQTLNHLILLTR